MKERDLLEECNDFVIKIEESYLTELGQHAQRAEKAMKSCGCRTCHHVFNVVDRQYWEELVRVHDPSLECKEEEDLIECENSNLDRGDLITHFGG